MKEQVDIILPFYNEAPFIRQSLQSVLEQSYSNIRVILINDGSTDDGFSMIQDLVNDSRVTYIEQENQGFAQSLNKGISIAQSKFIARHDGDDIMDRYRIESQVEHLIRHPQLAAIGTAAKIIDESGNSSNGSNGPRMIQHNTVPELLRFELTADCIFVHSSIMFNCAIIDKHLIKYDPKFSPMEDYALWVELFADPRFKVSNLTEALQNYREVTGSMIRRDQARNERVLKTIRKVALRKFLGRGRENGPRSWRQVYIRECLFLFKSAWKYSLVVFLSELFNLYRKHRSISYR